MVTWTELFQLLLLLCEVITVVLLALNNKKK